MADGVHVPRLAAHQVTGALLIIKRHVLFQKFPVYLASHVVEHPLRSRLKGQLVQKAQGAVAQSDAQQAGHEPGQQIIVACLNHIVHDDSRNEWVDDGQRRNDRGEKESQYHEPLVLLQESVEPFQRCHM